MKNNQSQSILKFEDIKPLLVQALPTHFKNSGISESVSLVDGFVSQPFSMQLSSSVILGGPMIPMVMLVSDDSGQIYFFALKAILKDIDI